MAGFSILTDIDGAAAMKTANKVAKKLGFSTAKADEWELTATKGNLVASIFLGAFIAYCDFRIYVEEGKRGEIEISIERNSPWWSGAIGVHRVNNRAKELADAIEDAILDNGGKVMKRGTF